MFWAKVERVALDGCWPWIGARNKQGYGVFWARNADDRRVMAAAHRVAWELASGQPVPDGMVVMHTCDRPACVRNDEIGTYLVNGKLLARFGHLVLGTAADNAADAAAKGRLGRTRTHVGP
jgi:hypothetical protein